MTGYRELQAARRGETQQQEGQVPLLQKYEPDEGVFLIATLTGFQLFAVRALFDAIEDLQPFSHYFCQKYFNRRRYLRY